MPSSLVLLPRRPVVLCHLVTWQRLQWLGWLCPSSHPFSLGFKSLSGDNVALSPEGRTLVLGRRLSSQHLQGHCDCLSADGSVYAAGGQGLGCLGLQASVSCCEHCTVSEVGLVFRATQLSCTLGPKHSLTAAGVQLKTCVSNIPGRLAVLTPQQGPGVCPQGPLTEAVHSLGWVTSGLRVGCPRETGREAGLVLGTQSQPGPHPPKSHGLHRPQL